MGGISDRFTSGGASLKMEMVVSFSSRIIPEKNDPIKNRVFGAFQTLPGTGRGISEKVGGNRI